MAKYVARLRNLVNNMRVAPIETVDKTELATRFRFALLPLVRQLRHHNIDLTASQASALATINRDGPLTVGDLAKAEHVSSPMITKIAKGLEEERLVTRTVDPSDKRVTQMAITKEGERRLERSRSRKNAWLARQLQSLSPEELAAIEAVIPVLERITERGATP
jgi:DNA-binding MarR family transcriptional regulator